MVDRLADLTEDDPWELMARDFRRQAAAWMDENDLGHLIKVRYP